MRILIFGDVHGNLPALEKMLKEEHSAFDTLLCHGDVVNYGPWSNECVQLLDALRCPCLKGNHEQYFLQGSYPGQNKIARTFFSHCYPSFKEQNLISAYGSSQKVGDYQVQHTVNDQYVYPDSNIDMLGLERSYIIGHSHHQFSTQTAGGNKLINTGSVGQNRKWINVINYVLYDQEKGEVLLKAIKYDVDVVINKMKKTGYPQLCLDYYMQKEQL